MNRLNLENGQTYIKVMEIDYNQKKYIYIINENNDSDIQIVEILDNMAIKIVEDLNLLKKIIFEMVQYIYKFYD